ncbi:MAG: CDP-glycerol glycerophosphotransferase family protein [Actinomycetota bacterium]|nr:CDP-glycerol glycerophosphotransferase family protein [Actinomycetota bacterium]
MQHVVTGSQKSSNGPAGLFAKRIARGLSRRLRHFGTMEPEGFDLENIPDADIALYFADQPAKLYQLTQWLPIFEQRTDLTTILVVRNIESYLELQNLTKLHVLLVPVYEDLMELYDRASFHAVVYVNNGWTNFQSLSFQQAVHIHVNHGESDKICMVSNQVKAYDKVLVAGQAAINRHNAAIVWFDDSRLVPVGRPQLDLTALSPLAATDLTTITYAPTWEGEDEANNYTSVDLYGVAIARAALDVPSARFVYKPHPRVVDSDDPLVRAAHKEIVALIKSAGGEHRYLSSGDILGVLPVTDLLIADVSSVTLDHLYLAPSAPIILTDRRSDRGLLLADSPVASACQVVDSKSVTAVSELIAAALQQDSFREARAGMRTHYFGHLSRGESTKKFWSAITTAIHEHDIALQSLQRTRTIGG